MVLSLNGPVGEIGAAWDQKFETGFYHFYFFHEKKLMKTFMCML